MNTDHEAKARELFQKISDTFEVGGGPGEAIDAIASALREAEAMAVAKERQFHPYLRIVDAFDKDDTAAEFMREDGDGGFAGCVYRMAREIDRLRAASIRSRRK